MRLKGIRRVAIIFIIVSLGIAALFGIVTLLTGDFGEIQGKILLTTLLLAGFSITALCHLAVVGRALRIVGFAGIVMSVLAFITGAVLIWRSWDNWSDGWETTLKAFSVFAILAASLAHANLLLLLAERRNPAVRIGLFITVGLIALLALLIILPIVTEGEIPGDDGEPYWRALGVVAILDVLGTIVLPVLGRFLRDGGTATTIHPATIQLDADATAKLDRIAAATGSSRDSIVSAAIAGLPESDAPE
jgi:hypothetical protein